MNPIWLPIAEAPAREGTFIVWLPKRGISVSAYPSLDYAADGNTPVAIEQGAWSMTDSKGGYYGLPLEDQPSHYLEGLTAP